MKYLIAFSFLLSSFVSFAQTDTEQTYTLDPASSKIIGGFMSFDGSSSWATARSTSGNNLISLAPYFSVKRTANRDILLVVNAELRNTKNGSSSSSTYALSSGFDLRNKIYHFNRFNIFGSIGPRAGIIIIEDSNTDADLGFNLTAVGNISLGYELTPNLRLLTSLMRGQLAYSRISESNFFQYNLRNSLVSPNFSIEYILPRKA